MLGAKPDADAPPESSDSLLVRLIHHPVKTLGPGWRVGMWLQGCSIRCAGCITPENHPFDPAYAMPVEEAARRILSCGCARLTVSGGEPLDQAQSLSALLARVASIQDILLYTGYAKDKAMREYPDVVAQIAALVDGEFRLGMLTEAVWKGSDNQTLTVFRGKFRARYEAWAAESKGRLQIATHGGETYLLGIPRQEDLPALKEKLKVSDGII